MTTLDVKPAVRRPPDAKAAPAEAAAPAPASVPVPSAGPAGPLPPVVVVPRRIGARTLDDTMSLVGSLVGSFAIVWIFYLQLLPFTGIFGFLVCWFAVFLGLYAAITAQTNPRPIVVDRLMTAVVTVGAGIVAFALLTTVIYVFSKGWPAYTHWNFFVKDMAGVGPGAPLTQGGIFHAIYGSVVEVGIAAAVSLPLGVGTAIYMTEIGGKGARVVRTVVEAMTALPDILAGLFIYTILILLLGLDKIGLCAAMALTVMMLPIIARSADVALRIVPGGLREASLALGASQWRTVWTVVLPTARSGLATALILGVARAVGETAPVLITSGASTFTNYSPLHGPMNSLPLFIYTAFLSGQPRPIERAFGAASVLLALVLLLFVVTRFIARDKAARR